MNKTEETLRQEAEEAWDNMDSGDYALWFSEYAEAGYLISETNTSAEKQEMFIEEYIEVNRWA